MRERLEQEFFPYVIKPGRYAGGEPGSIIKSPEGRLLYLHAYPDKYELGQSYVGLQTLYHLVNADERLVCERVFAPDRDAEAIMREKAMPLFSLESHRPARQFDVIGFTLVSEVVYTNLLNMLDLAGLPLRSKDRGEDDPLVFAGGPAVYNPEPIAPFIDLFFIGDAEEDLPRMLTLLREHRDHSRREKLKMLVREFPSVYAPCFYDENRRPLVDFAPETIRARVIEALKPEYYPSQPIVPLIDVVHDFLNVEVMRGCPHRCRFCLAEAIYRPVRPRPVQEVIDQVNTQLAHTGHSEVTLLSLSASDYPPIDSLVRSLAVRLSAKRVSIDLPSLRPGSVSPVLLDAVTKVRSGGLTVAPEAGTERLRAFLGKTFPDEAVYDTVRLAFAKGFRSLKLYFMIGLPTETEKDLSAIAVLANRVRDISREFDGKRHVTVRLSPFVPEPHTPFQWDQADDEQTMFTKIKLVKSRIKGSNIQVKYHDTRAAVLSCALLRGGREMAAVIETAFRKGARFDGWSDEVSFDIWQEAFSAHGVHAEDFLRAIPFSRSLPWSHIVRTVTPEQLLERRQATSRTNRDFVPQYRPEDSASASGQNLSFGRGKRKASGRAAVIAPTKNRLRLRWGKSTRYRYMSHLDNLRLIERALRRADLPVAYSQGNNPSMKLSFGPPLPLGFTSEAEYVDITLEANLMSYMIDKLHRQMPEGIVIHEAQAVLGATASLSAAINRAVYTLPVRYWRDRAALQAQLGRLLQADALPSERPGKKGVRPVDLRPALYALAIEDDELVITLGLGEGGYARPEEIVSLLSEGLTVDGKALPYHRKRLFRVNQDGSESDPMSI